jgi:hypothetical protein
MGAMRHGAEAANASSSTRGTRSGEDHLFEIHGDSAPIAAETPWIYLILMRFAYLETEGGLEER